MLVAVIVPQLVMSCPPMLTLPMKVVASVFVADSVPESVAFVPDKVATFIRLAWLASMFVSAPRTKSPALVVTTPLVPS